jgi:hypothetical protein
VDSRVHADRASEQSVHSRCVLRTQLRPITIDNLTTPSTRPIARPGVNQLLIKILTVFNYGLKTVEPKVRYDDDEQMHDVISLGVT